MASTEESLIAVADRLDRAARAASDVANDLKTVGNRLLALAVELDTARAREQRPSNGADES